MNGNKQFLNRNQNQGKQEKSQSPEVITSMTAQTSEESAGVPEVTENTGTVPEVTENTGTVSEVNETAAATPEPTPVVTKSTVVVNQQQSKQPKEGFTPVYKVELELNGYADAMDRTKSIVPEEGGKWQYSLFNNIKAVFAANSQEAFNAEFNTILHFFNKNKDGIFNEKFIFRFPEYWPGSQNEFTLFRRIVYLIIQTASVKERKKALEQISLETVVDGLTEPQKQMLFNFYVV